MPVNYREVQAYLDVASIDIEGDFHADISSHQASVLCELAKQQGYRKSKNAPGSTARMYFEALQRDYRKTQGE